MVPLSSLESPESPRAAPDISSDAARVACVTSEIVFMSLVISFVVALISSMAVAVCWTPPIEGVDAHLPAAKIGLQCDPSGEQDVELRGLVALPEDDVAFSEVNRGAQHHELIQVLGLELLEKGAPVQYSRLRSHNLYGKLRQKY